MTELFLWKNKELVIYLVKHVSSQTPRSSKFGEEHKAKL